MTQQERNGLNEAAEISAHAAGAVRGAIKTGKVVSGAAKGTAAAGPYGAAAAALWTHRKAVAAIIAGLLVLPVLFIMLLPSLIFGGLTKAGVEGSPDTPILNDNAAIVENINQISQAISDLLEEGQEDVRARIDTDFTASGADQKEIINPYESSPTYNANRFIAMYCAAKNQDYTSISLKDMEDVIRKAKDALYTFTSTEESRTTTVTETNTDSKTGKVTVTETEVTEIWKIYTIVYNGEAYFEDKIFALSDEQKGLAENYAQNLSVFLGDGMMQGLLPAESAGLVSLGDIRFSDGATQVVYYNQLDKRYASKPYGTDNIGTYGCGPTCMAMVVSSLTNETVDPVEMARWAYENGYWGSRSGSYHSLIPGAAKAWGLPVQGCGKTEGQRIVDGTQYKRFAQYFLDRGMIGFEFNGKVYSICITEAICFPQALAATAPVFKRLQLGTVAKATVIDIGGFTADYLSLRYGAADWASCDSLENGVITLYNRLLSKIRADHDLLLEETDIDSILTGCSTEYGSEIQTLVERGAESFVADLFRTLRERKIELRTGKVIFVGGGSLLLRKQIEKSGKVGTAIFVEEIGANAAGYGLLYAATKTSR